MSRYASQLGTLLVDDIYGELTSLLFRILLRHGRLSLPALQHHTCLSGRLVRHGLSVLIQQQLVLWYTSDNGLTTYEASPEAAYSLVRSGKYVNITQDRVGKLASDIVSNLLALGHARVGDFVQAYGLGEGRGTTEPSDSYGHTVKPPPNGSKQKTGGSANGQVTLELIHSSLCELLGLGLVSRVNASHFRSDADNRTEAEKIVPPVEHYKAKSKRENEAQWELSVARKLTDWKYGTEDETVEVDGTVKGKKRTRGDTEDWSPEKRLRRALSLTQQSNGAARPAYEAHTEGASLLSDDTILRVNHAKFATLMRNNHLITMAEQSICASTANVYAKVLHALEPKFRTCRDDDHTLDDSDGERDLTSLPQVSTEELASMIDDTAGLASALGNVSASLIDPTKIDHPKKRRKKDVVSEDEAMVDGNASPDEDEEEHGPHSGSEDSVVNSDSDEVNGDADYHMGPVSSITRNPHCETIREHLLLLARHPHKFLHHFPQTHILPERWTVDFPPLIANVVHHTLMQTITSRYGVPARRIVSILHEQGKVGEKDLTWISLMPQKPMRSYLAKLHTGGMIHLQEVPRDSSRTPARTMYLWFFDAERSKAKLLEETYKAMARCLQRARVEGEKVRSTVEKANRSDVIGKEEQFLSVQEREALGKWRDVEERIWGEVGRLDEVVAILRDY